MQTVWRELTDEEAARWPEARIGGALAWIVALTGVLTLMLAVVVAVVIFTVWTEGPDALVGAFGANRDGPYGYIPFLAAAGTLTLLIWGALTFVLTLTQSRGAPAILAAGAVVLLLVDVGTSAATQWLIASSADGGPAMLFVTFAPLAPRWLGEAATIAATIGYFLGGVRANAYFRRRVAVPLLAS